MSESPGASSPKAPSLVFKTALVSAGMLLSRVAGLARQMLFNALFGLGMEADAFQAALKIPNFLQNLFGDGVLSASMIPVYSRLVKQSGQAEADRLARTVLAMLALVTSLLVVLGIIFAPVVVAIVAPGFKGAQYTLTVTLVRIFFPGVGLLVGSAWCLAVLNTHGKFFNSYAAPTLWNAAIMGALVWSRHDPLAHVAVITAWGAVVGSVLQVGAQLPQLFHLMGPGWRQTRLTMTEDVRFVLASSGPVILSRGAIQVSAFIDSIIASLIDTGAVAALSSAQSLYTFPVSLFGMAISSAALPAMSAVGPEQRKKALAEHLISGQRLLIVLMVPSVVGFLLFGDVMASLLFERGRFSHADARYVWMVLSGSAVGLMATTIGRFYASAFYAIGDTKTPARFAFMRIGLVIVLGFIFALALPPLLGLDKSVGTAGLTLSAGLAGWVEFALLRRALRDHIDDFTAPLSFIARCWAVALVAAAIATGLRWVLPEHMTVVRNLTILLVFGSLYLAGAVVAGAITVRELRRKLRV